MKLRKPCEHGRYDRHRIEGHLAVGDLTRCPGGEFLADDTLVIDPSEPVTLEMFKRLIELGVAEVHDCAEYTKTYLLVRGDGARLKCEWIPQADALAVREGTGCDRKTGTRKSGDAL